MADFQVPADLNGVSVAGYDFEVKNGVLTVPDDLDGGVVKDLAKNLAVVLQAAAAPAFVPAPPPEPEGSNDQEPNDSEDGDK